MSDQHKGLLIDIGNTSIKFAFIVNGAELSSVRVVAKPEDVLDSIQANAKQPVFISSVGNQQTSQHLQQAAEKCGAPVHIATSQSEQFGITCAYDNVGNLGVDRWLAILAADEMTSLPFAVLDLGTAMTCDVVVDKKHLGGWIAPGFQVMRSALIQNTTFVFADDDNPNVAILGEDTPECVNHGCLAAAQGFVLSAEAYLNQRFDDYRLIVAGGNKEIAQQLGSERYILVENVVLSGLKRLAISS